MNKLMTISLTVAMTLLSHSVTACDDKACEAAYLSATSQYIENHIRQAETARTEREAHASNRERRDYAVQNHIKLVKFYLSK